METFEARFSAAKRYISYRLKKGISWYGTSFEERDISFDLKGGEKMNQDNKGMGHPVGYYHAMEFIGFNIKEGVYSPEQFKGMTDEELIEFAKREEARADAHAEAVAKGEDV